VGVGCWVGRGDADEERTREDLVYLYRRGECVRRLLYDYKTPIAV
jgi:hypothetical protein